eukprot:1143460-Pelagomonas_calceolata.AAC.1
MGCYDTVMPASLSQPDNIPTLMSRAKEEKREQTAGTSIAPAPNPKITYLPNLQNALKSHMHTKHRLGCAYSKTGYYSYYQSLLPHIWKKISNAFRNMPCISTPMKRTILQYRTGTLYNKKHAVCFKRSTKPLCPLLGCHQLDSALHMLSGCQKIFSPACKLDTIVLLAEWSHNLIGEALGEQAWFYKMMSALEGIKRA